MLTILLNSIFIYLIWVHVFRKGRSLVHPLFISFNRTFRSRKRYTFLVNRSAAAVIAQILIYIVLITWKAQAFKYSTATLFLIAGGLSFLVYTLVYLAITFLLYRAITVCFLGGLHNNYHFISATFLVQESRYSPEMFDCNRIYLGSVHYFLNYFGTLCRHTFLSRIRTNSLRLLW